MDIECMVYLLLKREMIGFDFHALNAELLPSNWGYSLIYRSVNTVNVFILFLWQVDLCLPVDAVKLFNMEAHFMVGAALVETILSVMTKLIEI